jgi:hypothetical protein
MASHLGAGPLAADQEIAFSDGLTTDTKISARQIHRKWPSTLEIADMSIM